MTSQKFLFIRKGASPNYYGKVSVILTLSQARDILTKKMASDSDINDVMGGGGGGNETSQ